MYAGRHRWELERASLPPPLGALSAAAHCAVQLGRTACCSCDCFLCITNPLLQGPCGITLPLAGQPAARQQKARQPAARQPTKQGSRTSGSPGMGLGIGVCSFSNSGKMSGRLLGCGVIHSGGGGWGGGGRRWASVGGGERRAGGGGGGGGQAISQAPPRLALCLNKLYSSNFWLNTCGKSTVDLCFSVSGSG